MIQSWFILHLWKQHKIETLVCINISFIKAMKCTILRKREGSCPLIEDWTGSREVWTWHAVHTARRHKPGGFVSKSFFGTFPLGEKSLRCLRGSQQTLQVCSIHPCKDGWKQPTSYYVDYGALHFIQWDTKSPCSQADLATWLCMCRTRKSEIQENFEHLRFISSQAG